MRGKRGVDPVTCAKLSAMAAQGQSWWPCDPPRGDRVFPETLPGETLIDVLSQAFHWRGYAGAPSPLTLRRGQDIPTAPSSRGPCLAAER